MAIHDHHRQCSVRQRRTTTTTADNDQRSSAQLVLHILLICLLSADLLLGPVEARSTFDPSSAPQVLTRLKRNSALFGGRKRNSLLSSHSKANHSGQQPSSNITAPTHHYFLEPWTANPNYWIPDRYHEGTVCLLAAFSGIVRIRPSNNTFRGGTFLVSPEDSLGRRSNCERNSRNMFWKFSQYDERELNSNEEEDEYDVDGLDDDPKRPPLSTTEPPTTSRPKKPKGRMVLVERSNRLLSAGFHVVGSVIEFHVAYIECLQQADKNVLTNRYRVYGDGVCVNLSVSFDIGSFGDRFGYECNHIWGKTLRDIHYNQNRRYFAGEVQITLKSVRLDKDPIGPAPFAFRKHRRRCAWDSVLGWQTISIVVAIVLLLVLGFMGLCVCSNASCNSADASYVTSNLCCLCSCLLCCCRRRRRQRPPPPRPLLMNHTPSQPSRPTANHHPNHHPHPNNTRAPPPPPPPPPPPSSSSRGNQSSHSRKPTFSTASYSNGSSSGNQTQQTSMPEDSPSPTQLALWCADSRFIRLPIKARTRWKANRLTPHHHRVNISAWMRLDPSIIIQLLPMRSCSHNPLSRAHVVITPQLPYRSLSHLPLTSTPSEHLESSNGKEEEKTVAVVQAHHGAPNTPSLLYCLWLLCNQIQLHERYTRLHHPKQQSARASCAQTLAPACQHAHHRVYRWHLNCV